MGELTDREKFFVEKINWRLLWYVNVILTTMWVGLAAIVPNDWFKPVSVVLMAVQNGFLIATRGEKYLRDRGVDIPKEVI